jgi:pilus assembly protein CpaE
MGQEISASQDGSEKSVGDRDSQIQQSGEGAPKHVATGASTGMHGTETAPPVTQEPTSGLTKARVMEIVDPASPRASALSVAVISPDENRRHAALRALGECHTGEIQEFASYPPGPDDAPRTLNRDFDVVLVDLDSDPKYALELVKNICINGLATVMVYSAQADQDLLLRSMRAGAREFFTLPFDLNAIAEALARTSALRIASRPPKKPEGRLLVFLSAKGGSGVTTLACNFAVSMAQESGKKILLIDLNFPLGGAAINLGIKAEHSIENVFQDFRRLDFSLLSGLLEQHASGLSVLAAPSELAPTQVSEDAIDTLLEVALENFDYVVVDAGSKLNLQRTLLFDESATVYLVTQVGLPELRNSNRLIARLSTAGSPKLEIVINRYDPLNMEIAEEDVTKALTRPAEWKIPNDYAVVRRMQSTATSLMEDDSEISRAIRQMAKAVSSQRFRKRNSGSVFR